MLVVRTDGVNALSNLFTFSVKVKPGARSESIAAGVKGEIVIKVRAKPVEGAANTAVIEALSNYLGIARSRISLMSGAKSKAKRFAISLLERDDEVVREKLENLLNG